MPPLPPILRPRLLSNDDGVVVLCVDDDRGAQRLALAFGSLGVAALFAAWEFAGVMWPGLVAVAALLVALVPLSSQFGRRSRRIVLSRTGFAIDDRPDGQGAPELPIISWPTPSQIAPQGGWLAIGPTRVPLHGEDDAVREALVAYVRIMARP